MKISIIIPYDKDRGYLKEAIQSAENQTFSDYEIILQQGDNFLGENINNALKKAKGDYIKILAEDDILPPNSLEDLYNGLDGKRWICGNAENFGLLSGGWELSPIFKSRVTNLKKMIHRNSLHGGTTLYEKNLLFEIGGFDETLWTAEEYDLHLLLFSKNILPAYIDKTVYKYRLHVRNKSMNLSVEDKKKRRQWITETIKTRYL